MLMIFSNELNNNNINWLKDSARQDQNPSHYHLFIDQ